MAFVATILVVFLILVLNEVWWRRLKHPGEFSRKLVHITVGSFVAFWPFFLSWNQILLLSAAFLVVVGTSKFFHVFSAIHSVQRPTYGELFFALAVGIIALVTHHKGIYTAALLQMSLADGLAAVVGTRYGKRSQYRLLGATKSLVGTATFFVISLALLAAYSHYSQVDIPFMYMVALAASTSLIENLGAYGLDNLLVPLLVAVALSH